MTRVALSSFAEHAGTLRSEIDARLDDYSQFDAGCPKVLREAIRYSLLGPGKRLRPMLTLMAASACGCSREQAMPAACAVEMVHAYSLIHDDLPAMDDDDLRRGRPTCHKKFGEANAILAGDALLALAFEITARDIKPPTVAASCCRQLARAAGPTQLVGGQVDDLSAEHQSDGGLSELEAIHHRKTGAMLVVSLMLGGLIADADQQHLQALQAYGRDLGLAFQIVDDLLDFDGTAEQLGKRAGKDADRGKLTYPGVLGVDASRHRAKELVDSACRSISLLGDRADGLNTLAQFVLERKR